MAEAATICLDVLSTDGGWSTLFCFAREPDSLVWMTARALSLLDTMLRGDLRGLRAPSPTLRV